ncbi:hypothetical protein ACHHY8_13490 [Enterobacter cloacae complex sp. 2024EL-00215]|uniref:hypothetical protein n=1 Tax=Enterobacter TaxID=547 RepID=UPI0015A52E70|nr:hypothetical protein [Enterobacter roggenkampii]HBL4998802.1 hypothetical protein [Enterobacter cloacae]HDS4421610.1 hypothetical protein [Enterobacter cloacae]HDT2153863.1 hypothetical protein [Enterobacter cloacae]
MTDDDFKRNYPPEQYDYVHISSRTKGSMGETEIDVYDIVSKETGERVLRATYTEHTNLRGLKTTENWNW